MLGEVLGDLIGQHRQLLELGKQKKSALIKGDLDRLSGVIQEESRVIREISQLESERQKEVSRFLDQKNIHVDSITMSDIIDMVDDERQKNMLRTVQEELYGVMAELRELNQLNRELIEQSLDYVNYSLELMTEEDPSVTYHKPDQGDARKGKGKPGGSIFDTKA